MRVVILCGGEGIRLKNMLEPIPKAMVTIGHRPIVWHVMKIFAKYGYTDFILALGKGGEQIRNFFLNYDVLVNNVTVQLGKASSMHINTENQEQGWNITFVDTGSDAGTGARISRCQDVIGTEDFFVTYADCLSNVNLDEVVAMHLKNKNTATLTGIFPPFRYGEFIVEDNTVTEYREQAKLKSVSGWVNGGFMIFNKHIFDYLSSFNECVLEKEIFAQLVADQNIQIYSHTDFWQCLDNDRDYALLHSMCEKNKMTWLF